MQRYTSSGGGVSATTVASAAAAPAGGQAIQAQSFYRALDRWLRLDKRPDLPPGFGDGLIRAWSTDSEGNPVIQPPTNRYSAARSMAVGRQLVDAYNSRLDVNTAIDSALVGDYTEFHVKVGALTEGKIADAQGSAQYVIPTATGVSGSIAVTFLDAGGAQQRTPLPTTSSGIGPTIHTAAITGTIQVVGEPTGTRRRQAHAFARSAERSVRLVTDDSETFRPPFTCAGRYVFGSKLDGVREATTETPRAILRIVAPPSGPRREARLRVTVTDTAGIRGGAVFSAFARGDGPTLQFEAADLISTLGSGRQLVSKQNVQPDRVDTALIRGVDGVITRLDGNGARVINTASLWTSRPVWPRAMVATVYADRAEVRFAPTDDGGGYLDEDFILLEVFQKPRSGLDLPMGDLTPALGDIQKFYEILAVDSGLPAAYWRGVRDLFMKLATPVSDANSDLYIAANSDDFPRGFINANRIAAKIAMSNLVSLSIPTVTVNGRPYNYTTRVARENTIFSFIPPAVFYHESRWKLVMTVLSGATVAYFLNQVRYKRSQFAQLTVMGHVAGQRQPYQPADRHILTPLYVGLLSTLPVITKSAGYFVVEVGSTRIDFAPVVGAMAAFLADDSHRDIPNVFVRTALASLCVLRAAAGAFWAFWASNTSLSTVTSSTRQIYLREDGSLQTSRVEGLVAGVSASGDCALWQSLPWEATPLGGGAAAAAKP